MTPLLEHYFSVTPREQYNSAAIAYLATLDHLEETAPEIRNAIIQELKDQRAHLKLIASENFSSLAVQLAMGNLLTDKYAEGFVHHRFYAGCENVDAAEAVAEREAKDLFQADEVYVQPHSGVDANLVAFWCMLYHRFQTPEMERLGKKHVEALTTEEHEKIRQSMVNSTLMGMSLEAGGHLTHGFRFNMFSKMSRSVLYGVNPTTEQIDYAVLANQVKKERPTILLAGYSAYPRRLDFAKFREIADSVGAFLWVDMAHFSGLVAGKVFQGVENPIPYADFISSTTHKTLRGPRGGLVLCKSIYRDILQKGCPLVLGGPLPHVIAAKAIAFSEANTPNFRSYAQRVVDNARSLGESLTRRGCRLTTGGTDNHMVIVDVSAFALTGRQAENALRKAGLIVNRNAIPFDQNGNWYTSGIRIGTPAATTLGMGPKEMDLIADLIHSILSHTKPGTVEKTGQRSRVSVDIDPSVLDKVKARGSDLLQQYPLYPEILLASETNGNPQTGLQESPALR